MTYSVTLYYKAVLLHDPNFVFKHIVSVHSKAGGVKCLKELSLLDEITSCCLFNPVAVYLFLL